MKPFPFAAPPDMCIERIRKLLKSGISQFVVGSPIGPDVREVINLINQEVIPNFG